MAYTCRDEIRFCNLLAKCKQRIVDSQPDDVWRIGQYVAYLETILTTLQAEHSKLINRDTLLQYAKEVRFLKDIVDADQKEKLEEKLDAITKVQLPDPSQSTSNLKNALTCRDIKTSKHTQLAADQRQQLLEISNEKTHSNIRPKKSAATVSSATNDAVEIDAVLKHHYQMQEQLADEFLQMATHLKHNVTAAGQVVRDDQKVIGRSQVSAEKNINSLEKECTRLEQFVNASCDLWLWFMLLMVFITFIGMVLFMRLFPKPY